MLRRHAMTQYRFGPFVVSRRRRVLTGHGRELPLIPRYFDLLVFLLEHRHEAVHRRDIFDRVWDGVAVSESALTQAIRTLRRTLDDDSREPRYIRTVSRHGYRFVFADVVEEDEPGPAGTELAPSAPVPSRQSTVPRSVARMAGAGAAGGAAAGVLAGLLGGAILLAAPESRATLPLLPVLATFGAACGALGGAGVSAGLAAAGAASRQNVRHLLAGGMAGGATVGLLAQLLGQSILTTLLGKQIAVGGGLEGLLIGCAAGIGYAGSPLSPLFRPDRRALRRPPAPMLMALACGAATLALTLAGRPLVGGTIHRVALASQGSQATLAPLGALVGEDEFGPVSRTIVGTAEGVLFGLGLAAGLTRRRAGEP
jgi:DNA-binding winged helix-turn-helix (wHTH) protein